MNSKNSANNMRACRRIIILTLLLLALFTAGLRAITERSLADMDTPDSLMGLADMDAPDSLIELAEKNPEALSFVQHYESDGHKKAKISLDKDMDTDRRVPLFIQWDKRWGYRKYGGDFLAVTGCGPTCLSMVKTALSGSKKWNPYKVAKMAENKGYYVEGQGSSWELMSAGAESLGLCSNTVVFDEEHIIQELQAGRPIICSMRPGDFTTTGHFLVLSDVTEDGKIRVNDPNSLVRSNKLWDLDRLMPQIRNLWSFDQAEEA